MPLFTRENARYHAKRGNTAKAAKRRAALDAVLLASPPPRDSKDPYPLTRLARVRAMLDKLDSLLATETDPQSLDRLASAQSKLSAQEFALAGRPMPGQLRPTAPVRGGLLSSMDWPVEPSPLPQANQDAPQAQLDSATSNVVESQTMPSLPSLPAE